MAKLIDHYEVKFDKVTDKKNNTLTDWLEGYVGKSGLLCVFVSERKVKGKKFVSFYPIDPVADEYKCFQTSLGNLTIVGDEILFKSNHNYKFTLVNDISKRDWERLLISAHTDEV